MPITTTPRTLINAAYAKSKKNQPGKIASESSELLALVNRLLRGYYAFGARVNPVYFAASADVAFAAGGWTRPEAAEMIFRIENEDGDEVTVVPFDQRDAEPGLPALYRLGIKFYPASADAVNPQDGDLTFFYAQRPGLLATLDTLLSEPWPEQYNELPTLDIALYLAIKDGRGEEVPGLTAERDRWARLFAAFLEHETANERRAYGHLARFNTASVVPTFSLITGAAESEGGPTGAGA